MSNSALSKDEIIKLLDKLEKQKIITPLQKHILLSSVFYNQSLKQIANTLGLSYENIRQKKSRSVKRIKEYLKKIELLG